ncbi:putative mercuric transport protein, selenocysteine-containing [Carboxydothermus islandicus]|uniref:Putative mercuric transport protein, selenocysteine-containing n=1 Tax=Carboxydothermus islandicus TaxID=661089 RepID=A0A1L8CZX2_9THEO|nr:putative mercuric transport protein, selenocysteine-containing [Carboxydothermus islandicus]
MVITFVFLGYAFYETYFKGKSSKLNKIVLWSATVLVVIVLTYTYRYTLLNLFTF